MPPSSPHTLSQLRTISSRYLLSLRHHPPAFLSLPSLFPPTAAIRYLFSILTIAMHSCALGMLYFGLRRYEALLLVRRADRRRGTVRRETTASVLISSF